MTTLAVHAWPGPTPVPQDGIFVIIVRTVSNAQRDTARRQIRQATRDALAAMLGLPPEAITITALPGSPPRLMLAGEAGSIGCSFAHEDGFSLAAINLHGAIGVDLMRVQDIRDWQTVARDYLGPVTTATLQATSAAVRPRALAVGWTKREAALKCHGQQLGEWQADIPGLTIALDLPVDELVGHIHW